MPRDEEEAMKRILEKEKNCQTVRGHSSGVYVFLGPILEKVALIGF